MWPSRGARSGPAGAAALPRPDGRAGRGGRNGRKGKRDRGKGSGGTGQECPTGGVCRHPVRDGRPGTAPGRPEGTGPDGPFPPPPFPLPPPPFLLPLPLSSQFAVMDRARGG
ncbi:hypothetical protein GCM10010406_01590 [Streptomyces thermolineatus]|uniref:Uncharacterized protein n=1 Tax=Streptomyces thermolineatus TaxID=44033 RepID=A0ABN3KQQ8_9ACTN